VCGIAGILRYAAGRWSETELADYGQAMLERLAARGPDDAGAWQQPGIWFGHRRLAILDLSPAGHQPMVDGALALVFNGCIYNHAELRQELVALGHRFRSHSDTEVILKAYQQWGEASVERFEGMFAFALWDGEKGRLWLVRDRFGVKPLYYAEVAGAFCFASTLPALLTLPGIDRTIDLEALHDALLLHAVVPAPRTILAGIRKVPPAHTMTVTRQGRKPPKRYWDLFAKRPQQPVREREALERLDTLLIAAVRKRLTADVPVGVLLSGGLDSSLIAALMAEAGGGPIPTFAIGFESSEEEAGDEFFYSDWVARHLGTAHQRWRITNDEVLAALPKAIAAMSEPMVSQDVVSFYLLAQRVRSHVKVVLSGQGADEVFGGYYWYPRMAEEAAAQAVAGPLEPGQSADAWRAARLKVFARHYFDRSHDEWLAAVHPHWHQPDTTSAWVGEALVAPQAQTFLDAVWRLDVTTLLVDDPVKRVDNMTMAWGLEARLPFLDHHLVEWAMQLPPEWKLRASGKWPLKALARGRLPNEVIDREKGYFPMPALKYVRGRFYELMADLLTSQAARERRLFARSFVDALLAEPERWRTPLGGSLLWHAALLEWWLQVQGL